MVLFFFFLGGRGWTLAFVRHLNIGELEEVERFLLRLNMEKVQNGEDKLVWVGLEMKISLSKGYMTIWSSRGLWIFVLR